MFGFGSPNNASASSSSKGAGPGGTGPASGAAPNRGERAQCWTARDAYFACLDKNGIIAAGAEQGKGPCDGEKKGYEGSCSRSWVSLPRPGGSIMDRGLPSDDGLTGDHIDRVLQ